MEDRQRERQRQPCRDEPPRRRNEQPNRRSQARQPCRRTSSIAQARMVTMSESAAEVRTPWQARFDGRRSAGDHRRHAPSSRWKTRPVTANECTQLGFRVSEPALGVAIDQGGRRIDQTTSVYFTEHDAQIGVMAHGQTIWTGRMNPTPLSVTTMRIHRRKPMLLAEQEKSHRHSHIATCRTAISVWGRPGARTGRGRSNP